jgi:hypothetical protein
MLAWQKVHGCFSSAFFYVVMFLLLCVGETLQWDDDGQVVACFQNTE